MHILARQYATTHRICSCVRYHLPQNKKTPTMQSELNLFYSACGRRSLPYSLFGANIRFLYDINKYNQYFLFTKQQN